MAGIVKTRSALFADILAIINDGGELTAAELREILNNMVQSLAHFSDDLYFGEFLSTRSYPEGSMVTKDHRVLVAKRDVAAGTFTADDWNDVDYIDPDGTITNNLDIAAGGSVDLVTVADFAHIQLTCTGAAQTITDMQNAVDGRHYLFTVDTGKTITFNHTGIGAAGAGQMVNKGGANLAIVGRTGHAYDWVAYRYDGTNDIFVEINSAIYP